MDKFVDSARGAFKAILALTTAMVLLAIIAYKTVPLEVARQSLQLLNAYIERLDLSIYVSRYLESTVPEKIVKELRNGTENYQVVIAHVRMPDSIEDMVTPLDDHRTITSVIRERHPDLTFHSASIEQIHDAIADLIIWIPKIADHDQLEILASCADRARREQPGSELHIWVYLSGNERGAYDIDGQEAKPVAISVGEFPDGEMCYDTTGYEFVSGQELYWLFWSDAASKNVVLRNLLKPGELAWHRRHSEGVWDLIKDLTIADARQELRDRIEQGNQWAPWIDLNLPFRSLWFVFPVLMLLLQVVFISHVLVALRIARSTRPQLAVAWIALYPLWLPRLITAAVLVILPLFSHVLWWTAMGSGWLAHSAFDFATFALTGVVGSISIYALHQLQACIVYPEPSSIWSS